MWHPGRCGSTVIADLIQQDGRIDWAGEILERFSKNPPPKIMKSGDIPKEVYRKIKKRQRIAGYRPFGFEMKLWHYKRLELEFEEVIEILQQLGFNKNIVLERKNYLRRGVSGEVARTVGQFHLKQGQERKSTKIKINVSDDSYLNWLKFQERYYQELKEKLPRDFLYLCYEDDIESDPYNGYCKIMQNFGYSPKVLSTQLVKTNPYRLSDIIENYDEVCNYLVNTPYHWMVNS